MNIFRTFLIMSLLLLLQKAPVQSSTHEFDYVIIGAGTAGAVVAKKLSDDQKNSVFVLHNGKNLTDDPLIAYSKNVPFTVLAALLGSKTDLPKPLITFLKSLPTAGNPLYITGETIPQPNADNRELLWVMALPLGGATSVNAGVWCEGTQQVYSQWEALAGPLWSVDRIFQTFRHLETYQGETPNPEARGHHGPINVHQIPSTRLSRKFTKAIINATGFPYVLDYNNPDTPIGVSSRMQITQKGPHGKYRVSSATAFLNPLVMDQNGFGVGDRQLRVLFEATALKAIWKDNKAVGVEYLYKGKIKHVYARKGVIVCAGLYSSQFLLHSGVGPASLLNSLEIPVIYDNPNVGQGLADQPHVVTLFTSNPKDTPNDPESIFSEISWLPTFGGDPTVRTIRFTTVALLPGFTLGIVDLVQPLSRGSVSINSANPLDPPVIDLGELSNSNDLALFRSAFTNYVKEINKEIHKIDPLYQMIFPDPSTVNDHKALTAFIKREVGSNMHFQSHCRMAPLSEGGVVDSRGQVYGVENLFIADDSIVPVCMDGSPMSSAYLIGANIASILLEEQVMESTQ